MKKLTEKKDPTAQNRRPKKPKKEPSTTQNPDKTNEKQAFSKTHFSRKCFDFASTFGPFWPPRGAQKSPKSRQQIDKKNELRRRLKKTWFFADVVIPWEPVWFWEVKAPNKWSKKHGKKKNEAEEHAKRSRKGSSPLNLLDTFSTKNEMKNQYKNRYQQKHGNSWFGVPKSSIKFNKFR